MSFPEDGPFLLEVLDEQDHIQVDLDQIRSVCELIFTDHGITTGHVNVVLVDNDTIQQYNRDFLQHDYPTDVISFTLEDNIPDGHLEGEILVSTEIAVERAVEFGWTADKELLLYIVHGTLHLLRFDDQRPEDRKEMRKNENKYLARFGIDVPEWDFDPDE